MSKEKQLYEILRSLQRGDIGTDLAHLQILRLFVVMESDCDHEWLNHSFDHFGFLQEKICDKCGTKQSVP
jgi:hypothetical protein